MTEETTSQRKSTLKRLAITTSVVLFVAGAWSIARKEGGFNLLYVGVVVLAIVFSELGRLVGSKKNAGGWGAVLGLMMGPLGILITVFIDNRPTCPQCSTRLNGTPVVCPGCHNSL